MARDQAIILKFYDDVPGTNSGTLPTGQADEATSQQPKDNGAELVPGNSKIQESHALEANRTEPTSEPEYPVAGDRAKDVISVRLPLDLKDQFQKLCDETQITMAAKMRQLVVCAVRDYVRQTGKKNGEGSAAKP